MKKEVLRILKEKGKVDLFTEDRFDEIKALMRLGMAKNQWLKMYLSLDPLNKAQWCADHLILTAECKTKIT